MDFERYLNFIGQPVLITDRLFQAVTFNSAFNSLFPKVERGENVKAFFGDYPALRPLFESGEGKYLLEHGGRLYMAHVSFVNIKGRKRPTARCVLLADLTETDRLLKQSEEKNNLLRGYNEQAQRQNEELLRRIKMEEQAAAIRETSVVLRDLHDTLGHTLTLVNALQKLALMALPDVESAKSELRESLRLTEIGIAELTAAGDGSHEGGLTAFFRRFKGSMSRVGLEVSSTVQGVETPEHRYMYADLSRICQEAATNSIRHGGATRLEVYCRFDTKEVSLRLKDNGHSKETYKKGNGLIGMEERVNNLFGDIAMSKAKDGGFEITIQAPVIRDEE